MNKDTDRELTFLDMMLCTMSGESPSKAIENQERRGQQSVVRNQRLPKKANSHTVDNATFFKGVEDYKNRKLPVAVCVKEKDRFHDVFDRYVLVDGYHRFVANKERATNKIVVLE